MVSLSDNKAGPGQLHCIFTCRCIKNILRSFFASSLILVFNFNADKFLSDLFSNSLDVIFDNNNALWILYIILFNISVCVSFVSKVFYSYTRNSSNIYTVMAATTLLSIVAIVWTVRYPMFLYSSRLYYICLICIWYILIFAHLRYTLVLNWVVSLFLFSFLSRIWNRSKARDTRGLTF